MREPLSASKASDRMFPGYKVITGVSSSKGNALPTLQVINRGFELFEIIPNEELEGIGA